MHRSRVRSRPLDALSHYQYSADLTMMRKLRSTSVGASTRFEMTSFGTSRGISIAFSLKRLDDGSNASCGGFAPVDRRRPRRHRNVWTDSHHCTYHRGFRAVPSVFLDVPLEGQRSTNCRVQ